LIAMILAAAVSTSTATFSARETRLYRAAVEATALSERALARLRVCEESLADHAEPVEPAEPTAPDRPAWPSMILGAAGGGIGAAVGWRAFGAAGAFAGASLMAGLFAAVF
jgi:uncharacterized protein YcfJ